MKKLLILFTVLLFTIGAGYAQNDPVVIVEWDETECDCQTSTISDYYKVSLSVYDDANNNAVITNKIGYSVLPTDDDLVMDAGEVLEYCEKTHTYTPSFTVSATVWFFEASPDPDVECCSGFGSDQADCRDFEAGDQFLLPVPLN